MDIPLINYTQVVHEANRLTLFCRRLTSHGSPHKKKSVRRRQNRLTLFFFGFFGPGGTKTVRRRRFRKHSNELKKRIRRDIWDAEIKSKDLELVLDDGIVDGDVVMDTTDSIDYTTNGVPTTQYVKTHGTLYVRTSTYSVEAYIQTYY